MRLGCLAVERTCAGRLDLRPAMCVGQALAVAALMAGCQAPRGASITTVPDESMTGAPSAADNPLRAAEILGLDRGAVRKLLGEPRLIRRDTPAEIWQYRTARCILDVVLYDQATGTHVVYTEARTPAAVPTPTERCLSDILTTRHTQPS